ncbi:hypothetical protein CISIN_1g043272mg, partial [Citrus sinensis]
QRKHTKTAANRQSIAAIRRELTATTTTNPSTIISPFFPATPAANRRPVHRKSKPTSNCHFKSIFFGQLTSYTNQLLAHAKQLFQFARNYPGLHQNSIPVIDKFYSSTRYEDELLLATAWLHRATNDQTYLNYLVSTGKTGGTRSLFAWDDKYVGAQVLAGRLVFEGQGLSGDDDNNNNNKSSTGASSRSSSTGTLLLPQYKSQAEQFICLCVQEGNNNNNLQKTPGGLLWFQPWIKLQYAATATFVVTVCSNYLTAAHASIQCSGGLVQPSDLMDLARSQADYILRKNPKEMSYTVGFGANYPTQPNHRGASIVSIKTDRIAPQWHLKGQKKGDEGNLEVGGFRMRDFLKVTSPNK